MCKLMPNDINIYRQLAGGTTAANVLHGSANAIGGQNAVVKWRWGADSAEDLLIDGAPQGIKFALGENPTRSNGGFPRDGNPRCLRRQHVVVVAAVPDLHVARADLLAVLWQRVFTKP